VAPKKRLLMALGLVVAIGGAVGLAFVAENFDETLRTSSQVEKELGVPVVFSFPLRKRHRLRRVARTTGSEAAKSNGQARDRNGHDWADSYQDLVNGLLGANGNGKPHARTVAIVGCDDSKLRSRVAAMLATRAAKSGAGPVLLIDGDPRRRRLAKRFHISDAPGWRDLLVGTADVESCVHRSQAGNLAVMAPGATSTGTLTAKPLHGALGQMEEIKADYELVFVDLPPGREWDCAPVSADWLDEVVLVVEAERTRVQAARRAKEVFERSGMRVSGVVFANRREHVPHWLYQKL
jgi:Mrp family chromosome partitioning ATPase